MKCCPVFVERARTTAMKDIFTSLLPRVKLHTELVRFPFPTTFHLSSRRVPCFSRRVRDGRDAAELGGAHAAGAPQAAERERRGRAGALGGLHENPQLHGAVQPLQEQGDHRQRAQVTGRAGPGQTPGVVGGKQNL